MMWTDNPALDAEREYNRRTAYTKMWEQENFKGNCPMCGKPMFDGAWSTLENAVIDDETDEYYHEACLFVLNEDRREEECTA